MLVDRRNHKKMKFGVYIIWNEIMACVAYLRNCHLVGYQQSVVCRYQVFSLLREVESMSIVDICYHVICHVMRYCNPVDR